MTAFLLALLAGAGFFVATLLVHTQLGASRALHHGAVIIAAGILLGVVFADLVPDALEHAGASTAALAMAAGFLALYLVETLTSGHTHHHEPHAAHGHDTHAHAHSHAPVADEEGCVPRHAVLPFLIGLGLHNLADGVIVGASERADEAAAGAVAAGILVHQIPVGLSFGAVLFASGLTARRSRRDALLVASLIPVGALLVALAPELTGDALGVLVAAAAGALLYIATGHLLPEAHSEERRPGIAAAFTASLLATIMLVGSTHEASHGHHDGDHEDEAAAHADDQ